MKKSIYNISFKVVLLMIIISTLSNIVSCEFTKRKNSRTDSLSSKVISFPKELFILENSQLRQSDSLIHQLNNKLKIISIIDGNCVKCIIKQLNKIDSIFNSILSHKNGVYITVLNVSKQDSAYFMFNIQPLIKAKGIVFWDGNHFFESSNKLITSHVNQRTFMVDSTNRIIQYGNPVIHPEVLEEYRCKLQKR